MINTVQEFILLSCFLIWCTTLKRSAHDKVLCKKAQLSLLHLLSQYFVFILVFDSSLFLFFVFLLLHCSSF